MQDFWVDDVVINISILGFCPDLTSTVGGFGAGFFLTCKDFGRMLDNFRLEQQENFLLQGQLCVLTLIRCPFHPRATAVASNRPRSFCQKCRLQVTTKHAYTLDLTKSEWADYATVQA